MTLQNISSDEFQRFQDQLIFLKEEKYKLEEKCEFLQRSLMQKESRLIQSEKDLIKANDLRNRMKSSKEIELIIHENEVLRERLSGIEGNFKLQNNVLKTECERLMSENERLKCQLETYGNSNTTKDINVLPDIHSDESQYKIRQLQLEITKILEEKASVEKECENVKLSLNEVRISEKELGERLDELLSEKTKLNKEIDELKTDKDSLHKQYSTEIERLELYSKDLNEKLTTEKITELKELSIELNEKNQIKMNHLEEKWKSKVDILNETNENLEETVKVDAESHRLYIVKLSEEHRLETVHLESNYDEDSKEKDTFIAQMGAENENRILELKETYSKVEEELSYTKEELNVMTKKHKKLLKDMRKQLEKEVRITQDTQSKLAEVVSKNGGSLNSQNFLCGSGQQLSTLGDDQSSVYSSSNNGILSDSQTGICSPGSVAVTDEELKILLDRVTTSQNEQEEHLRVIEQLEEDKRNLIKTVNQQQKIILNYIQRRGEASSGGGGGSSSTESSPQHRASTSDVMVLNGMLQSSPSHQQPQWASKLRDGLKFLGGLAANSSNDGSRVTPGELRQLQRVCEELMTRCLSLETDLQTSVDLNVELRQRLPSQVPD